MTEPLLDAIRESNRWLKILALPILREALSKELDRDELRRIYQESDGRQIREVAKSAGVGYATVQKYWQLWARKALIETTETEGRYRRLVDLRQIDLEPAPND